MKQRPVVILDFDRMLFDTDGYFAALYESVQRFGVSREQCQAEYHSRPPGTVFRFEALAETLAEKVGASPNQLVAAMKRETEDAGWFLYPDARPFLEDIQEKADVYLLTFGADTVQGAKVDATGIRDYFKGVVVTEEPKLTNQRLPVSTVSRGIFINDSIPEILELGALYRWSYHIHINRASTELPTNFPFASFRGLREAEPAVIKLVDAQATGQMANPEADQRRYAS